MAKSKKNDVGLVKNQPLSKVALLVIMAGFALVGVAFTISSLAAGTRGGVQATISINKTSSTSATFTVVQTKGKLASLWVSNNCYDSAGTIVSAENQPAARTNWSVTESPSTTPAFTLSGTSCKAYVWEFPRTTSPVSQTLVYTP